MNDSNRRIIKFEGARNVRDLGGISCNGGTTRFGAVYRGDGLSRLTAPDQQQFADLGIRTLIDLRYEQEREREPSLFGEHAPPQIFHHGFLPEGSISMFRAVNEDGADAQTAFLMMCSNYARMPLEHHDVLGDVLRQIVAGNGAPVFFHCMSGKDRTGMVAALILSIVGASRDDIIADYELSNVNHQPVNVFGPDAREDAVRILMTAQAEYLNSALDAIDKHFGSMTNYLHNTLEFSADDAERLRELLVES